MSAAAIARKLLPLHPSLFDAVPAARVYVGPVPLHTALPCISIREEISTDDAETRPGIAAVRVHLTVMAATYPACKAAMLQLRRAMRDFVADVSAFRGVTCRLDGLDPDAQTGQNVCTQKQDVRITFHESDIA